MVQAFSIGTEEKCKNPQEKQKNQIPGPGAYKQDSLNDSSVHKSPRWRIGSEKRKTQQGMQLFTPGVGTYNLHSKLQRRAPSYNMGLKFENPLSETKGKKNFPGPSHYKVNKLYVLQTPSAYSMRPKHLNQVNKSMSINPGPGNYKHDTIFEKITGPVSFPKQSVYRDKKEFNPLSKSMNVSPGPDVYNQENDILFKKSPRGIMGSSKREGSSFYDSKVLKNPGPGNYETVDNISQNAKHGKTIGIKTIDKLQLMNVPGPGAYSPDRSYDNVSAQSSPRCKIGKAKRDSKDASPVKNNPGPAEYFALKSALSSVMKKSPNCTFGNNSRDEKLKFNKMLPGPHEYRNPITFNSTASYSIGKESRLNRTSFFKTNLPAPDLYKVEESVSSVLTKAPQFKIGTQSRMSKQLNPTFPGPGNYSTMQMYKTQKGGSFSRALRDSINSQNHNPGPGNYKLPAKFADVPLYLIPNQNQRHRYV